MKQLTVSAPFSDCVLNNASVHVWWGDIRSCGSARDAAAVLSPDEKQRAALFIREQDRQRYIAARGFLRHVLSRYVGTEPDQLRFAYGVHGKPELAEASSGIEFNLSHTRDAVAVAVAQRRSVGIDLEYSGARKNFGAVAQAFFSAREIERIERLPSQARSTAFLKLWTRKEALLKACGAGLSAPHALAMDISESSDSLVENIVTPLAGKLWRVCHLNLQPALICSLSVQEVGCAPQIQIINVMEHSSADEKQQVA